MLFDEISDGLKVTRTGDGIIMRPFGEEFENPRVAALRGERRGM